jgi:hypothetical protein
MSTCAVMLLHTRSGVSLGRGRGKGGALALSPSRTARREGLALWSAQSSASLGWLRNPRRSMRMFSTPHRSGSRAAVSNVWTSTIAGSYALPTEGLTSVANPAPICTLLSDKLLRCAELCCQLDACLDGPDCFLVSVVVSQLAAPAWRRKPPGAVGAARSRRIRIPSIRYLLVLASQLTAC